MVEKRAMRVIVFFDLPTDTEYGRREYRLFRKNLLKMGFSMLQYSVYMKIVLNHAMKTQVEENVEKIAPLGDISILSLTETQFSKIKWIGGKSKSDILDNYERLIVI